MKDGGVENGQKGGGHAGLAGGSGVPLRVLEVRLSGGEPDGDPTGHRGQQILEQVLCVLCTSRLRQLGSEPWSQSTDLFSQLRLAVEQAAAAAAAVCVLCR